MDNYDDDIVIVGVRTIAVWQGGDDEPYANVRASAGFRRDPRLHAMGEKEQLARADFDARQEEVATLRAEGKRYCVCCGEWKDKTAYSPKADAADRLHPFCKECRAVEARRHYAVKRDYPVRSRVRREPDTIELQNEAP